MRIRLPTTDLPGFSSITCAMSSCTCRVCAMFIPVTKNVSSTMRFTREMSPLAGRVNPRSRLSRMGDRRLMSGRAFCRSWSVTSPELRLAASTSSSQSSRLTGTRRRNQSVIGFIHRVPKPSRDRGASKRSKVIAASASMMLATASGGMRPLRMASVAPKSHEAIRRAAVASWNSAHAGASSSPLTCAATAARYARCASRSTLRRCLSSVSRFMPSACAWAA